MPPEKHILRLNGVRYSLHMADCLAWMDQQAAHSIHAVVTDPPYGLKEFTAAEKHKHPDIAQQRFPDLSLSGRLNPPPEHALESKGSMRPWAIQSHYNQPGWYVIWRYAVDPTKGLKPGKIAAIWRVDIAFLREDDWKYEGSKAEEGRGGRTHIFAIKLPAKLLRDRIVYQSPRVEIRQGGPVLTSQPD